MLYLVILMICLLTGILGFSSTFPNKLSLQKKFYINFDASQKDKDTNYQSISNILNQEENYCFFSSVSNQPHIMGYPYGSVVAYSVNQNGNPLFGLSDISRHSMNIKHNNSISIVILEKNFKDLSHKRVIITGNVKKIDNEYIDYVEVPSDKTLELKNKFQKSHPNALWIDFPEVYMYELDKIIDIYYVGGFSKATKINVPEFLQYYNKNKK